jgi:hypothetical protein
MGTFRLRGLSILAAGAALSLAAPGLTAAVTTSTAGAAVRAPLPGARPSAGVRPNAVGELDCNGFSPIQRPAKPGLVCADPRGPDGGRFYDNGHYIGHDEPEVRFISSRPGSGSNVTITETLPRDPVALPTARTPGHDVTHWFELTNSPWLSMAACDPDSDPLTPCTPRSDSNAPRGRDPGGGAALVELQFYAPGMAPLFDDLSCDDTHWCSALTIDSLECQSDGTGNGAGNCNNNCPLANNSSFIQTNGVPTGPPNPQKADRATFTPNSHTLLMNPGDTITIHMWDATIPGGHALEARETDRTTGNSGFMIASARNGFMTTDPFTCAGTPFNFQPEYNTARAANFIPWTIGVHMIDSAYETGHWEACTSVTGKATLTIGSFKDTYYKHCHGPYETAADKSAEPTEALCFTKGDAHSGTAAPNLATGCDAYFAPNGDADFDGSPYWPDWPHSVTPGLFPSPFGQQQPTSAGHRYPQIQFMTNTTDPTCNPRTGKGCVLPPKGARFYPYFTLAKVGGACVWEFGNMPNGDTFGGDKQYGKPRPAGLGGFISPIRRNPPC